MFRSISLFAAVVLFQAVFAVDVSNSENQEFIYKGIKPIAELQDLMPGTHIFGFIGDLELGIRWQNDTEGHVFKFTGVNWTNCFYTFSVPSFTFPNNEIVHYAGILNTRNSYGVVCGKADELGSNESPKFTVRAASNSTVSLMITVFTHIIDQ